MTDAPPIPNQPPLADEELAEHLAVLIAGSPTVMQVLTTVRDLDLPDWRLFSGSIYQTVWNALTERDPDYGVKDYDIGYFDPDAIVHSVTVPLPWSVTLSTTLPTVSGIQSDRHRFGP